MQPKREILSPMDMQKWKKSQAYHEFIGFINTLNEAAKGHKVSEEISHKSTVIDGLLEMLNKLSVWIDEIPAIQQPQRFGNKAFKTWYTQVQQNSLELTKACLANELHEHAEELSFYLNESFGNSVRIDYGTGHEMSFAMFLMGLFKIGALKKEDTQAAVLKVFNRYLEIARKLQKTYNMEPAGSHGVWSLDDFQFLPFIFGSGQLIDDQKIEPKDFVQNDKIELYSTDNMFFSCIKFIQSVKTGPFAEHSNQLWNISALPTWSKVNAGLMKMYLGEVLDKFPVVQHVLFGQVISIASI